MTRNYRQVAGPLLLTAFAAMLLCVGGVPARAAALGNATGVAAGAGHACAVLSDTTVECWGGNADGRIGDGTTTTAALPVTVTNEAGSAALTGVDQIAVGNGSCAVMSDGTVRCWGGNAVGQLGIGTTSGPQTCGGSAACSTRPVIVKNTDGSGPLTNVAQVAVGGNDVCAVLVDTSAVCWGTNSDNQIGDVNAPATVSLPTVVRLDPSGQPLTGIQSISVGGRHACAVLTDHTARCWGDNFFGQLGIGNKITHAAPAVVMNDDNSGPLTGVTEIAAGTRATCARITDQTAKCWGNTFVGQTGRNTYGGSQVLPASVLAESGTGTLSAVSHISVAGDNACALRTGGTVDCWGDNTYLQTGGGFVRGPVFCGASPCATLPRAVQDQSSHATITGVEAVSTGGPSACALMTSGAVQCWGKNLNNEVGDGTTLTRCFPATVGVTGPAAQLPTVPTGTSATRGNQSATVRWALQTGDCGAPVQYFTITGTPGGFSDQVLAAKIYSTEWNTSDVFPQLTPGVTYTFTVTATNSVGTSAASAPTNSVTPLGPPNSPTAVSASPRNQGATVHWTAPTKTNGKPISGYTITPIRNGIALGSTTFNSTATTQNVTGLQNGKRLTFKVAAINGYGTGTPSTPSKPITIGAPKAPVQPTVTKTGKGAVKITFSSPANNGAPILRYDAICTSSNGGTRKTATRKASPIPITELTPAKTYRCTVSATNSRGSGPTSTASRPVKV